MRWSGDGDQENDARQVSGRKWSISFRGGAIRKMRGFLANECTRYKRQDSADAAALWHSFSERKNGVLAAPLVVLTSIKRSRPSGSKERISYPAPSPSSADIHLIFFERSGRWNFSSFFFSISKTNSSPARPNDRLRRSRSTGSNFLTKRSSCQGLLDDVSNFGASTKALASSATESTFGGS